MAYFIEEARKRHGGKYNYDLVEYAHSTTPGIIVCPDLGGLSQRINDHIRGNGCPVCAKNTKKNQKRLNLTTETYIEKAMMKHDRWYSYGKVDCRDRPTGVLATCRHHGELKCLPALHLKGKDCPSCVGFYRFAGKGKELHEESYEYHIEIYQNKNSTTAITCKDHGAFQEIANEHLRRGAKFHYPICRNMNSRINKKDFLKRSNTWEQLQLRLFRRRSY